MAIGKFAARAIHKVPTMEAIIVAVNTWSNGIPALERITGLTTMIYTIVKKVVNPAVISLF
ncbi:hypothetical protein N2384_12165 [Bacillus paralicheniformis]|nr:hypothetical protein [Bacillus paralicheniformis]UWS63455.1 hypothetical protein N2384_12165 [Bacillus paralicheniformis]